MIKPFSQNLKPHSKFSPLYIPEYFPQGMSAVIAGKINLPGPFLTRALTDWIVSGFFVFLLAKDIPHYSASHSPKISAGLCKQWHFHCNAILEICYRPDHNSSRQAAAMKGNMALADIIAQIFGIDTFAEYEQSVYDKYQKKVEREIVDKLNSILSSMKFVQILKAWGAKCVCKFHGFRLIKIQLKFGKKRGDFITCFSQDETKKRQISEMTEGNLKTPWL